MERVIYNQSIAKSNGFVNYRLEEFVITKPMKWGAQGRIQESFIPDPMCPTISINQLRMKKQHLVA